MGSCCLLVFIGAVITSSTGFTVNHNGFLPSRNFQLARSDKFNDGLTSLNQQTPTRIPNFHIQENKNENNDGEKYSTNFKVVRGSPALSQYFEAGQESDIANENSQVFAKVQQPPSLFEKTAELSKKMMDDLNLELTPARLSTKQHFKVQAEGKLQELEPDIQFSVPNVPSNNNFDELAHQKLVARGIFSQLEAHAQKYPSPYIKPVSRKDQQQLNNQLSYQRSEGPIGFQQKQKPVSKNPPTEAIVSNGDLLRKDQQFENGAVQYETRSALSHNSAYPGPVSSSRDFVSSHNSQSNPKQQIVIQPSQENVVEVAYINEDDISIPNAYQQEGPKVVIPSFASPSFAVSNPEPVKTPTQQVAQNFPGPFSPEFIVGPNQQNLEGKYSLVEGIKSTNIDDAIPKIASEEDDGLQFLRNYKLTMESLADSVKATDFRQHHTALLDAHLSKTSGRSYEKQQLEKTKESIETQDPFLAGRQSNHVVAAQTPLNPIHNQQTRYNRNQFTRQQTKQLVDVHSKKQKNFIKPTNTGVTQAKLVGQSNLSNPSRQQFLRNNHFRSQQQRYLQQNGALQPSSSFQHRSFH